MRNYVISAYAQAPSRYLSATDCRRQLAADASAVLRLHAFLEVCARDALFYYDYYYYY